MPRMTLPVLALLLLPLAVPHGAMAQEELTYTGSKTIAISILFDGALKGFEQRTGLLFTRLDLSRGGQQGVEEVAAGRASVAGITRPLRPEEVARGLVGFTIGSDCISAWVNRENPVASLTKGQLRDLLTGRARNWKEVGGKDLPVILVLPPPDTRTSTKEVVGAVLLEGAPYAEGYRPVAAPNDQLQEVSREPGAICLTGAAEGLAQSPEILGQVKSLSLDGVPPTPGNAKAGAYPLIHPFVLVTKGAPAGNLKRFIDFILSPEGQAVVARNFIPNAATPPGGAGDELIYGGSQTIALSVLFDGGLTGFERVSGLHFLRISTEGGSNKGITDLLEGRVTLAGSLRPLNAVEKAKGLVETRIGLDCAALWVNKANPVSGLSSAQIRSILTGKVRNWKEVGGADAVIRVFLAPAGTRTASQDLAQAVLLGKEPFLADPLLLPVPQDQISEVSRDEGAICFFSAGLAAQLEPGMSSLVKPLAIDGFGPTQDNARTGKYLLTRPLALVTKGEPGGKVKRFLDYILSPDGQAVVARNFIPVPAPR